jgi:hypothetical protein
MTDTDGAVFCWAILLTHEKTGKWHESPQSAIIQAERAKLEWVQISRDDNRYVSEPMPGSGPAPKWHEVGGNQFLKLVFRSHTLTSFDDPVARKCLGRFE